MLWGLGSKAAHIAAQKGPPVANNMTSEHLENGNQMGAVPNYIKKLPFFKPSCC